MKVPARAIGSTALTEHVARATATDCVPAYGAIAATRMENAELAKTSVASMSVNLAIARGPLWSRASQRGQEATQLMEHVEMNVNTLAMWFTEGVATRTTSADRCNRIVELDGEFAHHFTADLLLTNMTASHSGANAVPAAWPINRPAHQPRRPALVLQRSNIQAVPPHLTARRRPFQFMGLEAIRAKAIGSKARGMWFGMNCHCLSCSNHVAFVVPCLCGNCAV